MLRSAESVLRTKFPESRGLFRRAKPLVNAAAGDGRLHVAREPPDQFPKAAQLEAINVPADTIIATTPTADY